MDPSQTVLQLMTDEGQADPYPVYRSLRESAAVLRWQGDWFLLRHADVSRIREPIWTIHSPDVQPTDGRTPWERTARRFALFLDPPDHARIRAILVNAFTPRAVEALRPRVEAICNQLLVGVSSSERFDLVTDYAYALPVTVICELLDLPEADRADFQSWSRAMAPAFENQNPAAMAAADDAVQAMTQRLDSLIAERRRHLSDDLLSSLIRANVDDGAIDDDELLANLVLLFFGGHETTVNLISNGVLALLRNSDEWQKLVAQPDLARNAVEELLRYDSPVQLTSRYASADTTIGDANIRCGDRVQFVIGAANRDPDVFHDPDGLRIDRPNAARHLAFSGGSHYCIGAPLARLEAEVALTALAATAPTLQLAEGGVQRRPTYVLRGLEHLYVGH